MIKKEEIIFWILKFGQGDLPESITNLRQNYPERLDSDRRLRAEEEDLNKERAQLRKLDREHLIEKLRAAYNYREQINTAMKHHGDRQNRADEKRIVSIQNLLASSKAKHAADAGHSQLGGSRDKREKIRQAWATGNYKSRAQCAQNECGNIGMSLSVAIKALNNTPDPT